MNFQKVCTFSSKINQFTQILLYALKNKSISYEKKINYLVIPKMHISAVVVKQTNKKLS